MTEDTATKINRLVEMSHGETLDPIRVSGDLGCTPNTVKKHLRKIAHNDSRVKETDRNNGRNQFRTVFYVRTDDDINEIYKMEADKKLIAEELGVKPSDVRFAHGGTVVHVNRDALVNRLVRE